MHVADEEWASVKRNPSRASRSICGVCTWRRPVTTEIAIAKIVRINKNDVRPLSCVGLRATEQRCTHRRQQVERALLHLVTLVENRLTARWNPSFAEQNL